MNSNISSPNPKNYFPFPPCNNHFDDTITNYCINTTCITPLCPECIEDHHLWHLTYKTEADFKSFKNVKKHCVIKAERGIFELQQQLVNLTENNNSGFSENKFEDQIKRLNKVKNSLLEKINAFFNNIEIEIKEKFRVFQGDSEDYSILLEEIRNLIEELENYKIKLEGNNCVNAINKICRLNLNPLVERYKDKIREIIFTKPNFDLDFNINQLQLNNFNSYLNSIFSVVGKKKIENNIIERKLEKIEKIENSFAKNNKFDNEINVNFNDYFQIGTKNKYLHYFPFNSQNIYLLNLDLFVKQNFVNIWSEYPLKINFNIPTFHQSISIPSGEIYLIGGYDSKTPLIKKPNIFIFNFEKSTLENLSELIYPRSNHSVCYLNHYIYVIGGLLQNNVLTNKFERFSIKKQSCQELCPMKYACEGAAFTSFNENYLIKIGGKLNFDANYIELYNISNNTWKIIDARIDLSNSRINLKEFKLMAYSSCVQINPNEIFVFGGFSERNEPSNLSFVLSLDSTNTFTEIDFALNKIQVKPLPVANGFLNTPSIVYNNSIFAIQNKNLINDKSEEKRLIVFDSDFWF